MILVLIGCHGAGKTTLGRALSSRLGWVNHDEIGARLAADPHLRDAAATAFDEQEAFDEEVFRQELARDDAWDADQHRIVETWHPGNLAYATARSPRVAERYRLTIQRSIARAPAAAIEVVASREVLAGRRREPGQIERFLEVGRLAAQLATGLGIVRLCRVSTDVQSVEQVVDYVYPIVAAAAATLGGGER